MKPSSLQTRQGGKKLLLVFSLAVAVVGWEAVAQTDPSQSGAKPASKPSLTSDQERTAKILDFLLEDYTQLWGNREPLTRILAAMSIARLSQPKAIDVLTRHIAEDPSPVSSLVAWECLLSRAKHMTRLQYDRWMSFTPKVFRLGVINGNLRVGLLKAMATTVPTAEWKHIYGQIFDRTSSLNAEDIPTLTQLGKTLGEWKSPDLVEALIGRMENNDNGYRAELVLHEAGCTAPWVGNRMDKNHDEMWKLGIQDILQWWRTEKPKWAEKTAVKGEPWKKLDSLYLHPKLLDKDKVSPSDKALRSELERDPPTLAGFDLAFVVDVTGSMRPAVDWLMEDMRRTMGVLRVLAAQPRIGLTFYMDKGEPYMAKASPLVTDIDLIISTLRGVRCHGGGDYPEAVWEGLQACMQNSGWDNKKAAPKTIVLVGDAPPHSETMDECQKLLTGAANDGYHFNAVKVVTPASLKEAPESVKAKREKKQPYDPRQMLPEYDAMAKSGKGSTIVVDFAQDSDVYFEFRGKAPDKAFNMKYVWIAKAPVNERPSKELLRKILGDTVTPKYKDRLQELIPVLVEACAEYRPEKRPKFLDHPPVRHGGGKGGGHKGGGSPQ